MSWRGFYRLPMAERMERLASFAHLDDAECNLLGAASALGSETADALIENATGSFPLPLGWAVGVVVDGKEHVVPMAVEESSVVAAASHGAKMAAAGGGFTTRAMDPVTIGQVELRDVADAAQAAQVFHDRRTGWMGRLDEAMPAMVERGGGMRDLVLRDLGDGRLVVHLLVDTRDAMGANMVNRLCESISADMAAALGGRPGVRIVSNLASERLVTARCRVPFDALGGEAVARGMVEANDLALVDPYRAATHNKGIMNGVDPVMVATGNDWRAVEAAAHAYAAADGRYRALTQYELEADALVASLTLPMPVATVGGVTGLHPVARVCRKALGDPSATGLARIAGATGLAQNLAALRALAAEGIQAGHMALHARNLAMQAGLAGGDAESAAETMIFEGNVTAARARLLAEQIRAAAKK